jgi:hypothetical protein
MSWSRHKSLQRIRSFRATAPAASINLRNFDLSYMTARAATIQAKMKLGGKSEPLIFDVPPDTAIQVEGVVFTQFRMETCFALFLELLQIRRIQSVRNTNFPV